MVRRTRRASPNQRHIRGRDGTQARRGRGRSGSAQEVAHLMRVSVLGELSGAIAHEINQPLTAILSNAQAALHLLGAGIAQPRRNSRCSQGHRSRGQSRR